MSRIKTNINEVEAVKSQLIILPEKCQIPTDPGKPTVDLHRGVVHNGAGSVASPMPEIERLPFPTDSFPPPYAMMVREAARVVGVPESLPGVTVLGVISASLGSGLLGKTLPGWITSPNLYLLAVAESGVGKTETAKRCTSPLYEMEAELKMPWERETLPGLRAEESLLEKEIQILTKGVKATLTEKDRADLLAQLKIKQRALDEARDQLEGGGPTLIEEDTTSQKFAVTLQENDETLAIISSDGGDVVNNILGRNHKLDRVDDSLLVKTFSRDRVKVSRIGRPSVALEHPCVTMVLMVQPDKIRTLFGTRALIDGGLLPRFLVAMTDAQRSYISEDKPEFSTSINNDYKQAIGDLLNGYRLAKESRTVESSPEARRELIKFQHVLVDRHHREYSGIASFSARYAEQACRNALVLHAAKNGRDAANRMIDMDTARNAIALTEYFIREQLAILRITGTSLRLSQADRTVALAGDNGGSVKVRDLQRKRIVESATEGEALMAKLVEAGLFSLGTGTINGRPTTAYTLI